MSKFTRGFLFGAVTAAAWTLLNVSQSGKETRRQLKNYVQGLRQDTQHVVEEGRSLQAAVQQLTSVGLPLVQQTIKEVTTTLRHFQEENQPRIRRTQEKVTQLTQDLQETKDKFE